MNFSYLETRSVLEGVLGISSQPHVIPTQYTLDDTWVEFEKNLSNFKKEYSMARIEYTRTMNHLQEKEEEINVMKMIIENIRSDVLKTRLGELVKDCEEGEARADLTNRCSVLAGKIEAMKKALLDTNADKYVKFTCFVCMDKLVDLFIDPCGHVICEPCWNRTQNKETCPGCRTPMVGLKRIFTLA
jgi:hypothetical protein